MNRILLAAAVLAALAPGLIACANDEGASSVEYSRSREISSDIASTHETGPTSLHPGANFSQEEEPNGAFSWQTGETH